MSDISVFHHHVSMSTFVALLADTLLCFFAAPFVVAAVWDGSLTNSVTLGNSYDAWWTAGSYAIAMPLLFSAVGLYRRSSVPVSRMTIGSRILLALPVGALITYVMLQSFEQEISTPMRVATALAYVLIGLAAVRITLYLTQKALGQPRVLIVGVGSEALAVARDLESIKRVVVGHVPTTSQPAVINSRHKVFSPDESIEEIVKRHRVSEIIVAAQEQRGGEIDMNALLACRISGVPVIDLAAFYERVRAEVPVDTLKASWLIYGSGFVQGRIRRIVKRAFDIVSSSMLLMIAAPLMLLATLAIRLESRGPIIYRQERVGYLGRRFMCLKFRSMCVDAEADGVARWAVKNDARITRVGAFMRKTRIDELPQLFSVLRGEMSMVGPRPERPSFVARLRDEIPYYELRHSVKPGLTGWAQIRFRYGASVNDSRRKQQFDLYYVKNNSLFLDVLVLIETVTVVLFREGAN